MTHPRILSVCLGLLLALAVSPLLAEDKAAADSKQETKETKFYDPVKTRVGGSSKGPATLCFVGF